MLLLNISDIAILTVKGVNYHCIINDISKSNIIHLLKMLYLLIMGVYKMHATKINIKNQVNYHNKNLFKPR